MDVIIDGARDFKLTGEPEDLMAVVAVVTEHLEAQGRSVVAVEVDGVSLHPETVEAKLAGRGLSGASEMRFESEDTVVLVRESLADLREALPDLPEACRQLAAIFQGEAPEEGYEPFQELAGIWLYVKRLEHLACTSMHLDSEVLEVAGRKVADHSRELNGFLEEAVQALRDGDTVLLGDLLEYELAPRAELEADIVAVLNRHVPVDPD